MSYNIFYATIERIELNMPNQPIIRDFAIIERWGHLLDHRYIGADFMSVRRKEYLAQNYPEVYMKWTEAVTVAELTGLGKPDTRALYINCCFWTVKIS